MGQLLPPIYRGVAGKPEVYRGALMRSGTEVSFARYLDVCYPGERPLWRYEPGVFRRFKSDTGYKPDFYIREPISGVGIFYEIKPHRSDTYVIEPANRDEIEQWMRKAEKILVTRPDVDIAIVPWAREFRSPRLWFLRQFGRWVVHDNRAVERDQWKRWPW